MAEVISPIVGERIWALPVSGAAVKFLQYLIYRSEFGGEIPVRQVDMAREFKITPQAVSNHMAQLCDLNIVLRPYRGDGRGGNSYRLHPLAAKYESHDSMVAAFRHALNQIAAGDMPNLRLPQYSSVPPAEGRNPGLHVA
ncbi:hypothetical protein ACFV3E_43650 [Streptomyces sp. NPDC059718]